MPGASANSYQPKALPTLCHSSIHTYEHTRTRVYIKVCIAYFTSLLTNWRLMKTGSLRQRRKTREAKRGTITVVTTTEKAGNGKCVVLHIPVHLVGRSALKTKRCWGSLRAGKAKWRASNLSQSSSCTCCGVSDHSLRIDTNNGFFVFSTAAGRICVLQR